MVNRLLERVKFGLKSLVEGNVYCQYGAMQLAYHCKFLLPHDPDYTGVTRLALGEPGSDGILDVGANLGLSALSFRKLLPGAPIFSLEPNPLHEKWLARIRSRDENFDYLMAGAGEATGSLTLHVPHYRSIPLHTMASLDPAGLEETCKALYGRRRRRIRIITVPVTVLPVDQLGRSPELIKIDAEGFELPIVRGALGTIDRCRPHLLLENNPRSVGPVQELLSPRGYRCYSWEGWNKVFTPARMDTRNVYFIPEERRRQCPTAFTAAAA